MLHYLESSLDNPYWNIAVENYLLAQPATDVVTLYLWRNRRTVVIGQNQNPFSECNVSLLEGDGGYLMRRRTGGGAVYHDDGNLNFSFIVPKPLYDQTRQFEVLQKAVARFGIDAYVSGRNDVLADGRKFSGNAFAIGHYQNLHHGTILIKGNMADLQRYLKPKPAKLKKHGVDSVQSRVVNLSELNPEINSRSIVPALREAFEEVYGETAQEIDFQQIISIPDVRRLYEEFASDQWKYGHWGDFEAQCSGQFDWGSVELSLGLENHTIKSVEIASDALDLAAIDETRQLLVGATTDCRPDSQLSHYQQIFNDICSLIY